MTRNQVSRFHRLGRSLMSGILLGLVWPATGFSNHVTLHSLDDSVELSGELIGIEEGFYVVNSVMGQMRFPVDSVTCEGEGCPAEPTTSAVRMGGSDSMGYGLMPDLLEGFAKQLGAMGMSDIQGDVVHVNLMKISSDGHNTPLGTFEIAPTVTGDAFAGLLDKSIEVGMATRRISEPESRLLAASGAGNMTSADQERVVGIGGLVIITNPDVGIDVIGAKQIGMIYSGQITNWKQVGGPDLPIVRFDRQATSGPGAIFNSVFYNNLGFSRGEGITEVPSNAAMVTAVNSQSGAIGFVEHASAAAAHTLGFKSRCGIVFRPNAFALKTEEYPFISRLYLYNRADNTGEMTQAFLDYAISSAADPVVTDAGFIGLGILRTKQNSMGGRLGTLMNTTFAPAEQPLADRLAVDLLQYDRLSTTVRFASGSSQLDNKAQVDLERLVEYLQNLDGKVEVSLVGFTDTDGGFAQNTRLSQSRARNVATALARIGAGKIGDNVSITTRGFGELSPAVCNLSRKAKGINRRVEVWIRELR